MKEKITGIMAAVLGIGGLVMFFMSFTTGYYIFGEMNSRKIMILLIAAIAVEIITVITQSVFKRSFWTLLLPYVAIGLFAAAAFLLIGDRVEGIGNCIVTDYDAGHGGEEAIYYSLIGSGLMVIGIISNIIGCFTKAKKVTA